LQHVLGRRDFMIDLGDRQETNPLPDAFVEAVVARPNPQAAQGSGTRPSAWKPGQRRTEV
jgi:hypothetical protein